MLTVDIRHQGHLCPFEDPVGASGASLYKCTPSDVYTRQNSISSRNPWTTSSMASRSSYPHW
jgi:hypothetical protein